MNNKSLRKQISFNLHPDLHKHIKIVAAGHNISMNLWIFRAILSALEKEKNVKNING